MRWGIRTSLVVGLAGLLLAAGAIAAVVVVRLVGGEAEIRVLQGQRAQAAAEALVIEAGCASSARCAEGMSTAFERLSTEGVVARAVVGPGGRSLVGASGPDPVVLDVVQGAGPAWVRVERGEDHARGDGVDHRVIHPLWLDGDRRGAVVTVFTLDALHAAVAERQGTVMLYLLFDLIAVLLFGIYVSGRVVVRPVQALTEAIERVGAEGMGDALPPPSGPAELRRLGEAFGEMLDRLDGARADLVRSEKLATVGRLAAGVAHEVGNPLASVMGYVEYLRDPRGCAPEMQATLLARMDGELVRMRDTLRRLLDFSRPAPGVREAFDPGPVVEAAIELVGYQKAMVEVRMAIEGAAPSVMGDPDRLRQVVVNLAMNAADAMSEVDEGRAITVRLSAAGGMAHVALTDSGPGVDPEVAETLFEPFATTRPAGQGTGLGLAISRRLIEEMDGTLELAPPVAGEGATFVIALPISPESAG